MKNLTVKDHSVSKELFELVYNSELDMLVTTPQPKSDQLASYYETEDYISHTDTKRNFFEKVYHWVRSYSLNKKLSLVNSQLEKETINSTKKASLLDVGCGTGDFLSTCLKDGWNVTGIEPNQSARTIANSKTKNKVFDIDKLKDFEKHSFDVITLWHVLEHLPNLEEHISLFKSLLKENGVLIIAVPNFKSFDANYYQEFWAAYDVPRHLWHFSKKSIQLLFSKIDMNLKKSLPMKFDSYYVSMLSEKYKTGKMNYLKAFYIGLSSNFKALSSKEYSSLIYVIKNS
ncbi:class I SAM-dependent methyltransferase [Pseudofulvibacter geojedonensis]|uniref:Class I SAM-dependent methyltransferase n=1 Tax=Pseudofulvibacter geojedonensis TaxID=1123758 RepID=A0ABW3I4D2_9FLAO